MKRYFNAFICTILLFVTMNLSSQTVTQTTSFINRSHISIAKVQKEIYRSGNSIYTTEIKKAIKYQVIAISLFKQNKFKDALAYSYKARVQCIELCSKLSINENYNLNDDEKTYFFNGSFTTDLNQLDVTENKKIEDLDIMNVSKFLEIELSIK